MVGMKTLAAIRIILQRMQNSNSFGGAAATKARSAKSDDRVRRVGFSLIADTPVAVLNPCSAMHGD